MFIQITPTQIVDADKISSAEWHPPDPNFPTNKVGVKFRCDGMDYHIHGDNAQRLWNYLQGKAVQI